MIVLLLPSPNRPCPLLPASLVRARFSWRHVLVLAASRGVTLQASIEWDGRPRFNTIRDNSISDPVEGKGVAVTGSDDNYILDNVFEGIDSLRFDDASNTLVTGNTLPDGVEFTLEEGATLADGSQEPTD